MKLNFSPLIFAVIALTLAACAPPESAKDTLYTVSYDGNGADAGTAPATVQVKEGTVVSAASNPFSREGHVWQGWEVWRAGGSEAESLASAGSEITIGKANVTLKASWSAVELPAEPMEPVGPPVAR